MNGPLIEYIIRNVFFFEKSYSKCDEKTIPRPFLKDQNWAYIWINSLQFYAIF